MNNSFNSLLSIVLVPGVVELIIKNMEVDEFRALKLFYNSETYTLLSNEKTKVWHYSPQTIYLMWSSENKTGQILFPEE